MSFLRKLGNFAGDAASFAVPAGIFAGGTLLAGGNPLGGMALLGATGAGATGFAANEEQERLRKLQLQQRRAVALANLRNAVNPRANAQPEPVRTPKSGILETLGRATGQGIDTFTTAQQLAQAAKLRDLQIQGAQQGLDLGKQQLEDRADQRVKMQLDIGGERQAQALRQMGMERQFGADIANQGGQVDVGIESPYNAKRPSMRTEQMPIEQTAPPPSVMGGYTEQMAAQKKSLALAKQQEFENQLELEKLAATKDTANATRAGAAAAQDYVHAKDRRDFVVSQGKEIASIPVVKRAEDIRAKLQPLKDNIAAIKRGEMSFAGLPGLTMLKSYIRVYDDAQVTEGDISTIRTLTQSEWQQINTALQRVASTDNPNLVEPGIIDDMDKALTALAEAVNNSAYSAVIAYGNGMAESGLDLVDPQSIDQIVTGALSRHGLTKSTVRSLSTPPPEIVTPTTELAPPNLLQQALERQRQMAIGDSTSIFSTIGRR